jgi:hypothetical protein
MCHLTANAVYYVATVITNRCTPQVQQGAVWDSLLSLSPEQPQQMMLSISLKHKQLLTNKSGATRSAYVTMSLLQLQHVHAEARFSKCTAHAQPHFAYVPNLLLHMQLRSTLCLVSCALYSGRACLPMQ